MPGGAIKPKTQVLIVEANLMAIQLELRHPLYGHSLASRDTPDSLFPLPIQAPRPVLECDSRQLGPKPHWGDARLLSGIKWLRLRRARCYELQYSSRRPEATAHQTRTNPNNRKRRPSFPDSARAVEKRPKGPTSYLRN